MKRTLFLSLSLLLLGMTACTPDADESSGVSDEAEKAVRLMTLNPGHFHAGLVHKYAYDQVDQTVHIYAPGGQELESHLALIDRFNTRQEEPTHWVPEVHQADRRGSFRRRRRTGGEGGERRDDERLKVHVGRPPVGRVGRVGARM